MDSLTMQMLAHDGRTRPGTLDDGTELAEEASVRGMLHGLPPHSESYPRDAGLHILRSYFSRLRERKEVSTDGSAQPLATGWLRLAKLMSRQAAITTMLEIIRTGH